MDARQLLDELETQPTKTRASRLAALGKRSLEEPNLQLTFKELETSHGNYGKLLALWSTYGSRDTDLVLRCLACHSKQIQNLALKIFPLVASDADVVKYLRSLSSKTSHNNVSFRFVKRICELKRRGALDQYVEETLSGTTNKVQALRVLCFCSREVVERHLSLRDWNDILPWLPYIAKYHPEPAANLVLEGLQDEGLKADVYRMTKHKLFAKHIIEQSPSKALMIFKNLIFDDRVHPSWRILRKRLPSDYLELLCAQPERAKRLKRTGPEADTHEKIWALANRHSPPAKRTWGPQEKTWNQELAKCSPDLSNVQQLRMCLVCGVPPYQVFRRIDADAQRALFDAWKGWRKSKFEAVKTFDAKIPKHLHKIFCDVLAKIVSWDPFVSKGVVDILPEDIRDEAQLIFDDLAEPLPPELRKSPNVYLNITGLKRRTPEQLSKTFHSFPEAFLCFSELFETLSNELREKAINLWFKSRDKCLELCNQLLDDVILDAKITKKFEGLLDRDAFFGNKDAMLNAIPLERREDFFVRIYDLIPDKRQAKYELLPVAVRQRRVAALIEEEQEKNERLIQDPSGLTALIALLPWDDMLSKLQPMLQSSQLHTRSSGIKEVVLSGKHYPENLLKILNFIKKRGREQDQIRVLMLRSLADIMPEKPQKDILDEVQQIFQTFLNGADFSVESKQEMLKILHKIFFVNPEWSTALILKVYNRTTFRGINGFVQAYTPWDKLKNGQDVVTLLRKIMPSCVVIIKGCIETQTDFTLVLDDLVNTYDECSNLDQKLTAEEMKEIKHHIMADIWLIAVEWLDHGYRETPMSYPSHMLSCLCAQRPDLFDDRLPGVIQAFEDNKVDDDDLFWMTDVWAKNPPFGSVVQFLKLAMNAEWVSMVKSLIDCLARVDDKKFSKFVPELVDMDPSVLTRFVVVDALCKNHMNILSKYLGVLNPPRGLFAKDDIWTLGALDKARFYYSSWTPTQQRELSNTLVSIIFDETIAISKQVQLLRHLAGMPCNSAELCRLAELPDEDKALLTETALRALAKVDDPEEGKEALLKALVDGRSHIAATALRAFLAKLTIDEALQQLDSYPFEKVGVAKEVIRILDGYSHHPAAFERLVELSMKNLHRSVQSVLLETLCKHFLQPNFPWSYMMKAAESIDTEIVLNVLPHLDRVGVENLAEVDAKVVPLIVKLMDHPLAEVRIDTINKVGQANPNLVDPDMVVTKRLLAMLDKTIMENLHKEEWDRKYGEASAASIALQSMNERRLKAMRAVKVKER